MAAQTNAPAQAPDIVGQVLLIPVEQIEVGERLRPIDPVWADALGGVIAAEGQRTPIEVCRLPGKSGWRLVAGGHRLEGLRLKGLAYVKAIEVEADPRERIAREISENLMRRGLDPVERAAFIAEQVALLKARAGLDGDADGRAVSAAVRWQKELQSQSHDANATIAVAYGWAEEIGDRLGFSRRTIYNDLLLYRRLAPDLVARLRSHDGGLGHPVLKNAAQLRALAKMDEGEQIDVINRLLAGARSIAEASAPFRQAPQPDHKRLSAFIGAFSRMSLAEKKGALAHLSEMLPEGYRLTFGEQFNAGGFPETCEEERDAALDRLDRARAELDGLIEDELIPAERCAAIEDASFDLQQVRMAIVTDRFSIGQAGERA